MARKRLLDILVNHYPLATRERHLASILCGDVRVAGELCRDPAALFPGDMIPEIVDNSGFASRGGGKLDSALSAWGLDVSGLGFLDAGASTGGFTSCLLSRGASFVHTVDVGYNLLDFSLRKDSRVYVHERTNIMKLDSLEPVPQAAVADLSFRRLVPAAVKILSLVADKWMIALVKPQFEVDAESEPDFDGVLRSGSRIIEVVSRVVHDLAGEGIETSRVFPSAVTGRKGNQEVLLYLTGGGNRKSPDEIDALVRGELSGLLE